MSTDRGARLREQIAQASSKTDIDRLLKQGERFELASDSTKTRWKLTAERRLKQLTEPKSSSKTK